MTREELLKTIDEYKEKIAVYKKDAKESIHMATIPDGATLKAYEVILELAEKGELDITEALLKKLYALCVEASPSEKDELAVGYRTTHIKPEWAKHNPPAPSDLDHYMKHFMGQMQISRQMFHPIEFAAICHKRVLEICPFETGNEAVAMLVLNLILIGNGYEGIASFKEKESKYWDVLIKAQHPSQPDIDTFITFIAECVLEAEKEKYYNLSSL